MVEVKFHQHPARYDAGAVLCLVAHPHTKFIYVLNCSVNVRHNRVTSTRMCPHTHSQDPQKDTHTGREERTRDIRNLLQFCGL